MHRVGDLPGKDLGPLGDGLADARADAKARNIEKVANGIRLVSAALVLDLARIALDRLAGLDDLDRLLDREVKETERSPKVAAGAWREKERRKTTIRNAP